MKVIVVAISTVICLANAFASERFDAATWKNVQVYDVPALLNKEASLLRQIVGVRFNYRSGKLRHFQTNWYEAALWQRDPKAKKGISGIQALIAKKDVPAFQTITPDFKSTDEVMVYARVEKDADNNIVQLHLLGRHVTLDAEGNATVDW
jgi:hypothetical protein